MNPLSRQRANETNMTVPDAAGRPNPPRGNRTGAKAGTRALWRALAASAVVVMALVGGSTAALAHDQVEGSAPADGSTVAAMPAKVQITLSNTPAAIGSQINVVDAAGTNWSVGSVDVLDNVATQDVKGGAPAGKYTVKWRLVSSDSHPIEGQFTFTTSAAGSASGAVAGPVQSLQQAITPVPEQAPTSGGVPWSVVGLIGVLVVVVVAMIVVARRRLSAGDRS